jgi:hypothetical protein
MTTSRDPVDPRSQIPVTAIRHMLDGRTWPIPETGTVYVGSDPTKSLITVDGANISARHVALSRAGCQLRVRSVGTNPPRYRNVTFLDLDLPAGERFRVNDLTLLLLMSKGLLGIDDALAFLFGASDHKTMNGVAALALDDQALVITGDGSVAARVLALQLHSASTRPDRAFLVLDKHVAGDDLFYFLHRHGRATIFVNLCDADELDLEPVWRFASVRPALVRLVFHATSTKMAQRWLPRDVLEDSRQIKLRGLDEATESRVEMAHRVLRAQGVEKALDHLPAEVVDRVLHSDEVQTIGDLWWAPLRLAALIKKDGNVLAATGLLNEWGCPHGRKALDTWLFKLALDPRELARLGKA